MKRGVFVLVHDLFFGERLGLALRQLDYPHRIIDQVPPDLAGQLDTLQPAVVFVDLDASPTSWEPVVAAAVQRGVPAVAFGPHMDLAKREAALKAGCHEVLARSKITNDFPRLLALYAGQ